MAKASSKKRQQDSESSNEVNRRGLLRFGSLVTVFSGVSVVSSLGAKGAHAASGDKNPSTAYVPLAEKGSASGVATLDVDSKIPPAQLPDLSATYAPCSGSTNYAPSVVNGKSVVRTGELVVNLRDYGAKGDGVTDDSAAFAAALADGQEILVPDGTYAVNATITIPAGKHLRGMWSSIYTGNPSNGARLIVTSKEKSTPVVHLSINSKLSSVSIAGAGKDSAIHDGVRLGGRNVVRDVTIAHCRNGVDAAYKGVNRIENCQVHDNGSSGLKDPVDSVITHCYFNVNNWAGISLGEGANDNIISHCKSEWNAGNGIVITNTKHNIIVANNIDRNGRAGIRSVGNSKCIISQNVLRRNGRLSQGTPNEDTHLYQQDNVATVFQGNVTAFGADDGGISYTSPLVTLKTQGGMDVIFTANDFSGCTTPDAPVSTVAPGTRVSYFLNSGLPGIQTLSGSRTSVGSASLHLRATGGTGTGTFVTARLGTYSNGVAYRVRLIGRDPNSATRYVGEVTLLATRNSGDATVAWGHTANYIGSEFGISSGNITLSAAVSPDGSSLAITATNNGPAERRLSMTLE